MQDVDDDVRIAMELQREFDDEQAFLVSLRDWDVEETSKTSKPPPSAPKPSVPPPRRKVSVVDPYWELTDPNPDIHGLFLEFNDAYFWGKLLGVEVKWSSRMTLCAGLCCYEGRGGLCSVKLSEPLLKLRPRKDLVETLLHEMIHAFLFVTHNNRDHDAHGTEFHKHMHRINEQSGAKITVYHSFHDEVASYRRHWWRCTGPCQHRRPFWGMVKRAMNRAPSERDPWWADHQRSCGGTFVKIREPEGKRKDTSGTQKQPPVGAKKLKTDGPDIRTLFQNGSQAKKPVPEQPRVPFSGKGHTLGGGGNRAGDVSRYFQPKKAEGATSGPSCVLGNRATANGVANPTSQQRRTNVGTTQRGNEPTSSLQNGSASKPWTNVGGDRRGSNKPAASRHDESTSKPRSKADEEVGGPKPTFAFESSTNVGSRDRSPGKPTLLLGSPMSKLRLEVGSNRHGHGTNSPTKLVSKSAAVQRTLVEIFGDSNKGRVSGGESTGVRKVSRKSSSARMRLLRELISSDSDSDCEDVTFDESVDVVDVVAKKAVDSVANNVANKRETNVTAGAQASATSAEFVECPVCECLVEHGAINRHLDSVCLGEA
ncbi:DNA-dependent metalloprotease SPRTN [Ixodes scapularis]|uniref:DNA-dependent metalloprotease SPRTN n=1 Tax=Ixodes scapularis TaxID=6945 RepID=UPI001A9CC9E1|nr:DNA-dependent metalloprotease SPRTN [Ixodes scapularis]